jgi:hypothetical protein
MKKFAILALVYPSDGCKEGKELTIPTKKSGIYRVSTY